MAQRITSKEDFTDTFDWPEFKPAAWALGYATMHASKVVDAQFLHINQGSNFMAAAAYELESRPPLGGGARLLSSTGLKRLLKQTFRPYLGEPGHINIDNAWEILKRCRVRLTYGRMRMPIVAIIDDIDKPATDVGDAFLRLEMESRLMIVPNEYSFDKIFGPLNIVAHTNHGPFFGEDPELIEELREQMAKNGDFLDIRSLDKFPPLVSHLIPERVRIADTVRVRLGAHLSPGTTVMQTGFVNFNAGTLGKSMVEGSVSQGTTIGAGSDVGRGAGFVGGLSGGGDGGNSMGEGSLLGALAEVDISIGDNCLVAMGVTVSAGTPVWLIDEERWVKGKDIDGVPNLLIRRNATDGKIEALDITGRIALTLNDDLHA